MLKFLALAVLALPASSKSANRATDIEIVTTFTGQFIEQVRLGKIKEIVTQLNGSTKTLPEVNRFLTTRSLPYQITSLSKLIESAESVFIVPVKYEQCIHKQFGNGFTVFFMQRDVSVLDVLAQKKKWLLDYAACDFFVRDGHVSYGLTFCYEGTEGPFYISLSE